jgi:hypothetical protein
MPAKPHPNFPQSPVAAQRGVRRLCCFQFSTLGIVRLGAKRHLLLRLASLGGEKPSCLMFCFWCANVSGTGVDCIKSRTLENAFCRPYRA